MNCVCVSDGRKNAQSTERGAGIKQESKPILACRPATAAATSIRALALTRDTLRGLIAGSTGFKLQQLTAIVRLNSGHRRHLACLHYYPAHTAHNVTSSPIALYCSEEIALHV
jgi:hypothetical protein